MIWQEIFFYIWLFIIYSKCRFMYEFWYFLCQEEWRIFFLGLNFLQKVHSHYNHYNTNALAPSNTLSHNECVGCCKLGLEFVSSSATHKTLLILLFSLCWAPAGVVNPVWWLFIPPPLVRFIANNTGSCYILHIWQVGKINFITSFSLM